ncbi:NADH-quinone oxidoreductase subunit G [Rhodoligotrophos appendicifer]|uniref:NADH-quinone oxidoreductase subunit NuoG n=1 Tax=Rhodoligotrophos appendicifer TaxID=987056 RepID=UPI00118480F6|nr:NADH-quinone oxidoreductase subunit NuoG [Rhodoligotrophos appendicifer]
MPKLIVDAKEIEVENGLTVLQACEIAGAEIPRFCYHDRLTIAGNCRMCLVEVKGMPKPQASCALSVNDLRPGPNGEPPEVFTKSKTVKKAREGVMEFLLINHPLDCPICDQGGECDLQDQAMGYGVDSSRYHENKRAVEDKYIGPLVKTIMNRCIHCTRCVRFVSEVAGVEDLGAIGRGEDMEITTYLEHAMRSELQGNVIDLCPVGALTSRPYAFKARPWELRKIESIDVMDALGTNIRVDCRGREVMRIMPRLNEDINEEWMSDKSRFIWDGLRTQRLDQPYLRENGKLRPATWPEAFARIAEKVAAASPDRIGAIAGDLASVEELYALKDLMTQLNVASVDCRQDGSRLGETGGRASYLFNATVAGIGKADAILIIGSNPRIEAPVLNARLRKAWQNKAKIAVIGERADLTYDYDYLGAAPESLTALSSGEHSFLETLKAAKAPLIIVGASALTRRDGMAILAKAAGLAKDVGAVGEGWNGFCVLQDAASRVGGLDVGCLPGEGGLPTQGILEAANTGALDVLFLLGADEIDTDKLGQAFVVYIGTHGDNGAHRADVILPGAAYTEKSGTYVNLEGRPQRAERAAFPPGDAREDWSILRALSAVLGQTLAYDNLNQLRARLFEIAPYLAEDGRVTAADPAGLDDVIAAGGALDKAPLVNRIKDFYLTNPIARASKVMAECSALRVGAVKLDAAE